ncbi:CHAT domain-containing protein [Desmonostoc muscorum CCALA 125]|nr:CHAT domain-containing protein [Desmonostoc muscorum CCALA 125]
MADKPKSLIQRAIASPKLSSRTKELSFETSETAAKPTPTTPSIPKGTEIATERELPEAKKLYITMKLPQNVAILHISEYGENKYSVWGGHLYKKLDRTDPENKPDLSLGRPITRREDADGIKEKIEEFSDLNAPLRKWLKYLRKKFCEDLCLIIVDHTNFEIPWEMLELSPYKEESKYQYIGALITTVRWRKVNNDNDDCDDPYLVLQFKEDECCGEAVAYLLDTELEVGQESEILRNLGATKFPSSRKTIKDFHNHLHSNNADHSFVYMSCHGILGKSPDEIILGSQRDQQQQLKLRELRERPLNPGRISQGIVFMNTCHSAREVIDPVLRHSYRKNFIELFLRQGARGVIGTLGAVNNEVAADFACELIKECLQSSPLPVAALLKKLRLKAVEKLYLDGATEKEKGFLLLSFINTFMYVYYGSPMTVLRLTRQGE